MATVAARCRLAHPWPARHNGRISGTANGVRVVCGSRAFVEDPTAAAACRGRWRQGSVGGETRRVNNAVTGRKRTAIVSLFCAPPVAGRAAGRVVVSRRRKRFTFIHTIQSKD